MKTMILRPGLLGLAGLLLILGACNSNKDRGEQMTSDMAEVECICGTPEAAFDGCPHPLCLSGEGNPDNPECVCGGLDFDGE